MSYVKKTIQKRFPLKTLALVIVCIILSVIIIALLFPWVGSALIGLGFWVLGSIWGFFAPALPQVLVTVAIVSIVIGLVYYRKVYGKKKVLMPMTTGTTLPTADRLAEPLFGDDTKVESA